MGQESLRHSAGVFSRASVESWSNLFDSPAQHLLSLLLTEAVALILISQPLIPKLSYQRSTVHRGLSFSSGVAFFRVGYAYSLILLGSGEGHSLRQRVTSFGSIPECIGGMEITTKKSSNHRRKQASSTARRRRNSGTGNQSNLIT